MSKDTKKVHRLYRQSTGAWHERAHGMSMRRWARASHDPLVQKWWANKQA